MFERGVEQRDRLRTDALQAQQVEDRRRELLRAAPGDKRHVPVSASSRIFVGEILADARQLAQLLRRPCGATGSAQAAMVSAAERYARILKAFSPLISSRSAISRQHLRDRTVIHASRPWRSMRVVEQARAAGRERRRRSRRARRAGRSRTGSRRRRHRRPSRRSRRPPCARAISSSIAGVVTPGASRLRFSHSSAIARPTPSQSPRVERLAHRGGGVADALEAVEDVAVAVDVLLGDLPVVGARVARLARVAEDDAAARAR